MVATSTLLISTSTTLASSTSTISSSHSQASLLLDPSQSVAPVPFNTSNNLSAAAKIGISFGAALSGCAILAGGFLIGRFWRSKSFVRHQGATHQATDTQGASSQGTVTYHLHQPWVHENPQLVEADGKSTILEMQSRPIFEMSEHERKFMKD